MGSDRAFARGVAVVVPFLVGGVVGCATGVAGGQDDSGVQQDTSVVQRDAAHEDASGQDAADAPLQQDAPLDSTVKQDAQRDTAVQRDAQKDTAVQKDAPTGHCTQDIDCPEGQYCFTDRSVCYTPGTCASGPECLSGECLSNFPLGYACSCRPLTIPPVLCRPYEQCVPVLNLCQPQ